MNKQSNESRKEAIRKYKERKPLLGAYAIRCKTAGAVWVGTSPNLDAARNAFWSAARAGYHLDKPLQQAWNTHGESAFEFEVLETLDEDIAPIAVRDSLKQKKKDWAARLTAQPLI